MSRKGHAGLVVGGRAIPMLEGQTHHRGRVRGAALGPEEDRSLGRIGAGFATMKLASGAPPQMARGVSADPGALDMMSRHATQRVTFGKEARRPAGHQWGWTTRHQAACMTAMVMDAAVKAGRGRDVRRTPRYQGLRKPSWRRGDRSCPAGRSRMGVTQELPLSWGRRKKKWTHGVYEGASEVHRTW